MGRVLLSGGSRDGGVGWRWKVIHGPWRWNVTYYHHKERQGHIWRVCAPLLVLTVLRGTFAGRHQTQARWNAMANGPDLPD